MNEYGYMPVSASSMQAIWLVLMGLTGAPSEYFLQQTGDDLGVWLMTEGTASSAFEPAPGYSLPRVSATLSGYMVDPATIVVNRS